MIDFWTDDPELDMERDYISHHPEYEDWEERLDRLRAERELDPDYYEYHGF